MKPLAARLLALGALSTALSIDACARNAFLELEIELPKNPVAEPRYANIRIMSGPVDFAPEWQGENAVPPVQLDPAGPKVQRVSVEATDDSEEKQARVKVRFCKDPHCVAIGDDKAPEAWLTIERAFYIGKRTSYRWKIDCIPNSEPTPNPTCTLADRTEVFVPKCKIGGCVGGNPTSNYCVGDKHHCED